MRTLLATALLSVSLLAAKTQSDLLVSTQWLFERLNQTDLVILHVGPPDTYAAGHIPGARLVTLADISVTGPRDLRLQLPEVEALRAAFGKLGITDAARIVVYAGNESVQSATRVWFTLDYLGLGGRASLLDGGLAVWKKENRPLSQDTPTSAAAEFAAKPRPEAVVDAESVRARSAATRLIDARTPEFYTGANSGMMPRGGHIPGAESIPYTKFLGADGKLLPEAELRTLLGFSGPVITYCHIGQQATVPYFVARYLGITARLYDGSFQDWSTRPELPVATGPNP